MPLTRFAWLSIAAALVTMGAKLMAWWLTGSVGLLSDALESGVNLVAASAALVALHIAARPADATHTYGHGKAEYLSASLEGALILLAAGAISWVAVQRLLDPKDLSSLDIGLAISVAASLVNLAVAIVLGRVGKRRRSIALQADSQHLMTDVVTSAGVVVGVGLVAITGWDRLDPIVALLVAVNILRIGWRLLWRSASGLMDEPLEPEHLRAVSEVLSGYEGANVQFHAIRSRRAGQQSFLALHVLVPGDWSVQRSHDLLEQVESDLRDAVPGLVCELHVEPLEDPASFADVGLERSPLPPSIDERRAVPPGEGG